MARKILSILTQLRGYFLAYQIAWILDESRLKIYEKSRRIGITYASTFRRVLVSLLKPHNTSWIISRDATGAKEFIAKCKGWIKIVNWLMGSIPTGFSGLYEDEFYIDEENDCLVQIITFPNGSTIRALSSNVDACAGLGGDVVIDEMALHDSQEDLFDVALYCIMWGGQLEIISTHRGVHTLFNQLIKDAAAENTRDFSHHRTDLMDAVRDGFIGKLNTTCRIKGVPEYTEETFIEKMKAVSRTEEAFMQECMCCPTAKDSTLLPWEWITRAEIPELEYERFCSTPENGPVSLGVDVGRKRDLTVFYPLEKINEIHWTKNYEVLKATPYPKQELHLFNLIDSMHISKVAIDSTGLGLNLSIPATKKYGDYMINSIDFTNERKEEMASLMYIAFQNELIKIPRDHDLAKDLYSVEKMTSKIGVVRYQAPVNPDGHSDRFWAMALALSASGLEQGQAGGVTVPQTPLSSGSQDLEDWRSKSDRDFKKFMDDY